MHVTSDIAKLVLPILAAHAANLLENAPGGDQRRADLAVDLRAAKAGANAVEGLNQNTDDKGHETFPDELDTFWRILVAFEENALGGSILRGGTIEPPRNGVELPATWMLHAAGMTTRPAWCDCPATDQPDPSVGSSGRPGPLTSLPASNHR